LDLLETCRKFIGIDSTASAGTLELARFAAGLCEQAGLHVDLQIETLHGIEQANLIARPSASQPAHEFMLQTHLDTVDPGNYALWSKTGSNPFSASIYMESIYGLGSADTKLDFICKLKALEALKGSKFRLPPVLVGTFGEELGMTGAVKLIRKKRVSAQMALVGEPTGCYLIHAGKGFALVEIEIPFSIEEKAFRLNHDLNEGASTQSKVFAGRAAHSSSPEHGESAILKMLEYLSKLPEGIAIMELEGGINFNTVPAQAVLEVALVGGLKDTISRKIASVLKAIDHLQIEFAKFPDESFKPPQPTLNIGMVRSHDDHIAFSGCSRLPPTVSHDVYEKWMSDLARACEAVGATFRITEYKQPFRTSLSSDFVRACQAQARVQGLPTEFRTQSVTNEANVFSRLGIECLVFGPGQGVGNSHSPEEHVPIQQLNSAIDFYRGVIERVCL
jgi:acetylornithine deacetylase/succinyl-diaminopimelate desuccinylase-like protein